MRPLALAILLGSLVAACGDDATGDAGPRDAAPPDAPSDGGADGGGGAGADAGRAPMASCDRPAGPFSPLSTRCQHLVDAEGRVVVLRGINARVAGLFDVTFDDGRAPLEPIPDLDATDAARMRQLGFNVLRLPINWSGVEPADTDPPTYDEAYLARLGEVLDLAGGAGLLVLVDFHQDAYSKHIGEDGAPLWAISPPPEALLEGPLEDLDARRQSRQVLEAFATFFGDDEPGPRLRARFAAMAAAVARRFADHPAVMGWEIFNEPVASDEENLRLNVLVAEALRAADPDGLIVFEPPAQIRVLTDRSMIAAAPFPVPGAVYAPHVYTLAFTGTEAQRRGFTRETLRRGNASAALEAASWGTPLFITEFGYDPAGIRWREYLELQLDIQDELGASSALWLWKEESQGSWGLHDHDDATGAWSERPELRRVVSRPTPQAIAGWPVRWAYDRGARRLELVYRGDPDVRAPTRIYVPAPEDFAARYETRCDGVEVASPRDPSTGVVEVACGGEGLRTVTVEAVD